MTEPTIAAFVVLMCAFMGPALIASIAYVELVPTPGDGHDEYVPLMLTSNGAGLVSMLAAGWVLFA